VVSSSAAEIGDNTTELDASIDGDAMEVAFNGRYFGEALGALEDGGSGDVRSESLQRSSDS
jgi:hypothetical protein